MIEFVLFLPCSCSHTQVPGCFVTSAAPFLHFQVAPVSLHHLSTSSGDSSDFLPKSCFPDGSQSCTSKLSHLLAELSHVHTQLSRQTSDVCSGTESLEWFLYFPTSQGHPGMFPCSSSCSLCSPQGSWVFLFTGILIHAIHHCSPEHKACFRCHERALNWFYVICSWQIKLGCNSLPRYLPGVHKHFAR